MHISRSRIASSLFFFIPLATGVSYAAYHVAGISAGVPFAAMVLGVTCLVGLLLLYRPTIRVMPLSTYLPVFYLVLSALAAIRAIGAGSIQTDSAAKIIAVCVMLVALTLWIVNSQKRAQIAMTSMHALALGCFVYAAGNLLLFALGMKSSEYFAPPAVMLQAAGIDIDRVHFIGAPGINAFGFIGGFAFVSGAVWLRSRRKLLGLASMFVGLAVILLTDSRGAALAAAISCCTLLFARLAPRRLSALAFALVPVLSIVVVLMGVAGGLQDFSRDGGDISSSRALVWTAALGFVSAAPSVAVTGVGMQGYAHSLSWLPLPTGGEGTITMHNSYIEALLTVGILGPLLLFAMAYYTLQLAFARRSIWGVAILPYIMVVSGFEVVLSPLHPFFPIAISPLILLLIYRNHTRN